MLMMSINNNENKGDYTLADNAFDDKPNIIPTTCTN